MLINFWTAFSAQAQLAFSTNTKTIRSQNIASNLLTAMTLLLLLLLLLLLRIVFEDVDDNG